MGETKSKWPRVVLCVDTGVYYASIRECSEKTGIPYGTLYKYVKNNRMINGRHFVFVDAFSKAPGLEAYINNEVLAKKLDLWGESVAVSRCILDKVPLFTIADLERAWEAGAENERNKHNNANSVKKDGGNS